VCSPSDISAFITACGDNGGDPMCSTWLSANVAGEGGAGTACGNCIAAPAKNNGAVFVDVLRGANGGLNYDALMPNYAACIQLLDPTNGPACAAAMDTYSMCDNLACDPCYNMSQFEGMACDSTTPSGCVSYSNTQTTACMTDMADGGAQDTCSPGQASGASDPDYQFILTLICGSADAGTITDGASGG
jgi:hypothetical protein